MSDTMEFARRVAGQEPEKTDHLGGTCGQCSRNIDAAEDVLEGAQSKTPVEMGGLLQRLMARLADLLDDDKFNNIQAMVEAAGYTFPTPLCAGSAPVVEPVNLAEPDEEMCQKLAALGWQKIVCGMCGHDGARGYPRGATPLPSEPPSCLTCSDHGSVGVADRAEPCPDCTPSGSLPSEPQPSNPPPLPAPFTAVSTIKCTACGAPYQPAVNPAPHAAAILGSRMTGGICKCGNAQWGGTISSENVSPAQFTADQMNDRWADGWKAGAKHGMWASEPLAAAASDPAYSYALNLATLLWSHHYKTQAPEWKPQDDTLGLLTQIDNMVAGITKAAASPDVAKMMENCRALIAELVDAVALESMQREIVAQRALEAAIDALGAAATQARAAASEPPEAAGVK